MRIGELAEKTGVSVRSLRYYEEQGLLLPARSPSGQRHYREGAVDRVHWIRQLYAAGLSSKTIARFLPCAASGAATPEGLAHLAAERERIDAQVRDLVQTRDRLDTVIAMAARTVATGEHCASTVKM
ncbi:MerR family transcriptional regulator [Amycolatopsis sp. CA-230715]|uniref:MerR family transcriptional regulator n=1 Tax=Amycolatopsis sp. CA-230715 TaxID=2745196 RepID=UPI001C012DAE|nr:MerR family transcriptional regulator [Amycolatopsis sp. CA-230715]QWF83276.1 hypothetical protein HUW46_06716 [Amycolatopsis sp. CA-230715]